ncbi:MAG: iron chelate uptake ABC transporter family permease subunit [Planctomycetia bacterium]|nr:iron chelate uptake ABC transporter family permease subunit [Planctomycetia bacterium]
MTATRQDAQTPLIVRNLSCYDHTGKRLLHDVSFELQRGEHLALLGVNGAGKSTTLRALTCTVSHWSGDIFVFGKPIRSYSHNALAQRVALARPCDLSFGFYRVRQVVELARLPYQRPLASLNAEDRRAVDEALACVDALEFADRTLASLSDGERQKIMLAMAFAQEPEILLLDEPASFLDYQRQVEIVEAIQRWTRDHNAATIEATHDLNRVALHADRVLALRQGRLAHVCPGRDATSAQTLRAIFNADLPTVQIAHDLPPFLLPALSCASTRSHAQPGEITEDSHVTLPDAVDVAPSIDAPPPRASVNARDRRDALLLLTLAALAIIATFLFPLLGKTCYCPTVWLRFPTETRPLSELDVHAKLFWGERMPKTALASLAGASLALAGLALQTLFRNPLATPYTLGIASGASFGATFVLQFCVGAALLGLPRVVWGAALGALGATLLVYALSKRAQTPTKVLLAGVAVGFFFASLVMCEQYVANPSKTHVAMRWTLGSLDLCEPGYLLLSAVTLALAALVMLRFARQLDAVLLGEERAAVLGVDVQTLRKLIVALTSCLVGVIVAFCGPIGFVGLTAPHLARALLGQGHAKLIPGAIFTGAIFLASCQTVARTILFPSSLPVGIIASLVGGPCFLVILLRKYSA